jgi:hypothetical protein
MFKPLLLVTTLSFAMANAAYADEPIIDIESAMGAIKVGTDGVSIKADGTGGVNINTKGSDPNKVCGETKLPRVVIHAKMAPLSVSAGSVEAQAAKAISDAGLKTKVAQTPVAVCLISNAGELRADLSRLNMGRLDVHSAAGTVEVIIPNSGAPTGRLFTDTGVIDIQVPKGMGVVLNSKKAGLGAITLDGDVARRSDKNRRANFTATTTAGIIQVKQLGAAASNDDDYDVNDPEFWQ